MYKCGLLGRNIGYSISPEIHNDYYRQRQVPIEYELFDTEPEELNNFIINLKNKNIIGFNVTIPYKEKIIEYLDYLEYPANMIKAVNTVLVNDDALIGYNTDYYGFIKSLEEFKATLKGKNALVLGSGGSAKSIYRALSDLKCCLIDIECRNIENIDRYFEGANNIFPIFEERKLDLYDIIVNCTPVGSMNMPNLCPIKLEGLKNNCIVYDLIYRPEKTRLLEEAIEQGAVAINGEVMLKQQAIMAADIWINNIENKL